MDPAKILNRGRTSALEGRHAQALRDFVWFHEHALEHDRAYYGVRLSFALGYWEELAEVYPPALEALQAVKRRSEATLLGGGGDRDLFNDVKSINRELSRTSDTYDLFLLLKKEQPELAKQVSYLAIEAIVEARDFKLASEHLPHPESYLLWLSDRLNEDLARKGVPRGRATRLREVHVQNYCSDVKMSLKILRGLRNFDAAEAALEWAVALVHGKHARAMVCAQLNSN